ncbi:MAG: hypothetical protein ABIH23_32255 [bacterium]
MLKFPPKRSILEVMRGLLKDLDAKLPRIDPAEQTAGVYRQALPKTPGPMSYLLVLRVSQIVTMELDKLERELYGQPIQDVRLYHLEPGEVNLLQMADRKFTKTDDYSPVEKVWQWIAKRTGIGAESVKLIPGAHSFYATPVNQNKEMNNETLSAFVGRGVDACVA